MTGLWVAVDFVLEFMYFLTYPTINTKNNTSRVISLRPPPLFLGRSALEQCKHLSGCSCHTCHNTASIQQTGGVPTHRAMRSSSDLATIRHPRPLTSTSALTCGFKISLENWVPSICPRIVWRYSCRCAGSGVPSLRTNPAMHKGQLAP